jgi:hypothetical protein
MTAEQQHELQTSIAPARVFQDWELNHLQQHQSLIWQYLNDAVFDL